LQFHDQAPPAFGSREYNALNEILIFQRKFDEVIAKMTAGLEQAGPDKISLAELARVHLGLGEMHLIAGRPAEARPFLLQAEKELMTLRTQGNNGPEVRARLIEIYACLGRKEDVDREATDHIAQQAKDRWTGPLAEEDVARAYIILGENDRALSILERLLSQAYADSVTPALLRLDPLFDRIRNDPRFRKLSEAQ
jgi:tetratricopeptide (TPR) repeat protein